MNTQIAAPKSWRHTFLSTPPTGGFCRNNGVWRRSHTAFDTLQMQMARQTDDTACRQATRGSPLIAQYVLALLESLPSGSTRRAPTVHGRAHRTAVRHRWPICAAGERFVQHKRTTHLPSLTARSCHWEVRRLSKARSASATLRFGLAGGGILRVLFGHTFNALVR